MKPSHQVANRIMRNILGWYAFEPSKANREVCEIALKEMEADYPCNKTRRFRGLYDHVRGMEVLE